jgi:hypothetical protein
MNNMKNNGEEIIAEDIITEFEDYLNHSLTQIQPDPVFVVNLQKRLSSGPTTILENRAAQKNYLILALTLFGGLFIFWLIRYLVKKLS